MAYVLTLWVALTALLGQQGPAVPNKAAQQGEQVRAVKVVHQRRGPQYVVPGQSTEAEVRIQKDIWTLDEFSFLPPRLINVDIPGRGRKLVWYMVYRVVNRSDQPRRFVPLFTLKTDTGRVYRDVVIPKARWVIQATEDPLTPLRDSVTISGILPPSKEEGVEHAAYGVAMWLDVDPKTDAFSIYVRGLSNGFKVIEDPASGKRIVLRKELELKFARPGDEFNPTSKEIRFIEAQWVYR